MEMKCSEACHFCRGQSCSNVIEVQLDFDNEDEELTEIEQWRAQNHRLSQPSDSFLDDHGSDIGLDEKNVVSDGAAVDSERLWGFNTEVEENLTRGSTRVVSALSGDRAGGHVVASPVKKERLKLSEKELAEEAAKVFQQADSLNCVTSKKGNYSQKFYSLPTRRKLKTNGTATLDIKTLKNGSVDLVPPRKPPRTFTSNNSPSPDQTTSVIEIYKKQTKPEPTRSRVYRSISDASSLKSKAYGANKQIFRKRLSSDTGGSNNNQNNKKQLSPIIELIPKENYFADVTTQEFDNIDNDISDVKTPVRKKRKESVTEQLKQFIDEVDEEIFKETGKRPNLPKHGNNPKPIIIDVDKAEKISSKSKNFRDNIICKKLKSISNKRTKPNDANKIKKVSPVVIQKSKSIEKKEKPNFAEQVASSIPQIKSPKNKIERCKHSPIMIHSSQKPAEKLPLTKGRTVNSMVKRLSSDSVSPPPPKTNIIITPNHYVQHNNNKPFSYTRGSSPEKFISIENIQTSNNPIIYAQVVCGFNPNGPPKQTIHTTYNNGYKYTHSDSDEGLGGEENSGFNRIKKSSIQFEHNRKNDYFDEVDKLEEESPITPKFRNPEFVNTYSSLETNEPNFYIDSSSRGRGDGMDAKRRESLTEQFENEVSLKQSNRTDLSARRDLLESRITQRLNDNSIRTSPQYLKAPKKNIYIAESTCKYYRDGAISPFDYSENYIADGHDKPEITELKSKQYFGESNDPGRSKTFNYSEFASEPKSFDSHISDYRFSSDNRQLEASHRYNTRNQKQYLLKNRDLHKSTPEIRESSYHDNKCNEAYHNSLRRDKVYIKKSGSSKYKFENDLDENEKKDKFGDSGIENDMRRESLDNFRVSHSTKSRNECCNESEDEGFASSLLIASERQHTEDNINLKKRNNYESDNTYSRNDDTYRHPESMEYRNKYRSNDYIPRERSIDDGSHYDPRIDREVDTSTLKRVKKMPPKPEKKSSLEKVKSLFTSSKKKTEKRQQSMVPEENLRARYTEYKGRNPIEPKYKKKDVYDMRMAHTNGRRLSSPSNSPTREPHSFNRKSTTSSNSNSSWFKSLDRLTRKKPQKIEEDVARSPEDGTVNLSKQLTKSLRFFGDTDIESNDSLRRKDHSKPLQLTNRSQSTRDLQYISEELLPSSNLESSALHNCHKSMTNITATESDREVKGSRLSVKPPASPSGRYHRALPSRPERGRRRKNEVSSIESSTEGDSSQQSQKSVVYLHAATVGDIPGPGYPRNGKRAASREELSSNSSSRIQPQVKTLSRSFSVLAPWRPRFQRESMDIDYTEYPKVGKNGMYEQKISKNSSRKDNSSTLKKKAQESKRSSTLNNKSKENIFQTFQKPKNKLSKGTSSTLYIKKDRLPKENSRYSRDDKRMSAKSLSVEYLGSTGRNARSRNESRDISRSISMPRDPEKSAGWFKTSKRH